MTDLAGKTVLITGATGFLGGALARRLAGEGIHVKALARRPNRDRYIRDVPGIEIVMGDIMEPDRMQTVMQGCDVVFHVAAALTGDLETQRRVNVGGTRNVVLAAAAARVNRLVHVSTIAVYGYLANTVITEDTPHDPRHVPYNASKSSAETELRLLASEHDLDWCIVRPGMIYGPRSYMWTRNMFTLARRDPVLWIGDGSGTAYPIHVDDVVDLLVTVATHPAASREAFHAAPDPSPTWREFLGGYSRLAGHQNWRAVPPGLLRPVAFIADPVMTLMGSYQDMQRLIPYATGQTQYSMAKAKQLLDWQPGISLTEGIESCVPYLSEKGLL